MASYPSSLQIFEPSVDACDDVEWYHHNLPFIASPQSTCVHINAQTIFVCALPQALPTCRWVELEVAGSA